MRFSCLRAILIVALAANGVLIGLVGCGQRPAATSAARPISIHPPVVTAAPSAYLGNAACAECHRAEYASQSHTRHAHTLMEMTREDLGTLAPPAGRVPGTGIWVTRKGNRFGIGLPAHGDYILTLGYALGSGKSGMTYVSVLEDGRVAEMAMSYFPRLKTWHVTPGDEDLSTDALGKIRPPQDARTCFSCHAVMPSSETVVPPKRFFGVGCESCHGPGGAHVTQMRSGRYAQDPMEHLDHWSATRILDLCGQCHGSAQAAMTSASPVSMENTNRFQPFGLAQSQCFKNSKDTLSCVTCHDSHINVSTNQKAYEAVCLSCHTSAAAHRPLLLRTTVIKMCPVNQTGNCIRCHMPTSSVIDKTTQTRMADHFIRAHTS